MKVFGFSFSFSLSLILSYVVFTSAMTVLPRISESQLCPTECASNFALCQLNHAACYEQVCTTIRPFCGRCSFCRISSTNPPPPTGETRQTEPKFCPTECANRFAQCKLSPVGCAEEICSIGNTELSCRTCNFCRSTEDEVAPKARDDVEVNQGNTAQNAGCDISCMGVPPTACRNHPECWGCALCLGRFGPQVPQA